MAALPDINVLVALSYGAHVHHAAALAWLEAVQKDGDIILCRLSQFGLLRLLNNPIAMGADVQTGFEAWKAWDAFLGSATTASICVHPAHLRINIYLGSRGSDGYSRILIG